MTKPIILRVTARGRVHRFVIDTNLDGEARIRNARDPHAARDSSVTLQVGDDRQWINTELAVEVAP